MNANFRYKYVEPALALTGLAFFLVTTYVMAKGYVFITEWIF